MLTFGKEKNCHQRLEIIGKKRQRSFPKKRLKQNQNRKQALKALSKKARRKLMAEKICVWRLEEDRRVFQQELLDLEHRKDKERSKALFLEDVETRENPSKSTKVITFNTRGQGLGNSLVGSFLFALITCAQHTHLTKLSGNDLFGGYLLHCKSMGLL